jgi:threonine/homoserine/homoserine lactone efflux protein
MGRQCTARAAAGKGGFASAADCRVLGDARMETLLIFASALLVAAATPGPGIVALVARALGAGGRATLPMIAGMILGEVVVLLLAVLGLATLAAHFGAVFLVVKWLGVAYLVYLAWRLWSAPVATEAAQPVRGRRLASFGGGLALMLGNPKMILFYVALLPTFLDVGGFGGGSVAGLAAVAVAVLCVVYGAYVAAASRARALFVSRRARRRLNRGAGAAMLGAAGAIAST